MDNLLKKKLIASFLAIGCAICVILLSTSPESLRPVVTDKVDSLVLKELSAFNIAADKYRVNQIDVDSNFARKDYHVLLPSGVSRTWFHSELSRKMYDIDMATWADVNVPEQKMRIHVLSDETIIRSISLETDTTYHRRLFPAIAMIYFERPPSEDLLNQIKTLGEPITLVLQVESAAQAETWSGRLDNSRHSFLFWITDNEYYPGADFNEDRFLLRANNLAKERSQPGILFFQPESSMPGPSFFDKLSQNNIRLIQTRGASIISNKNGRLGFAQAFESFSEKARRGQHPIALIQASEESLEWFADGLTELKKGGVVLGWPSLIEGAE
ncbi:MAG: hypothetical protein WD491_03870 [Balneolales bacterium]